MQVTQAETQLSLAAADLARYRDLKARNFISALTSYIDIEPGIIKNLRNITIVHAKS